LRVGFGSIFCWNIRTNPVVQIAVIALANSFSIATRNVKDFNYIEGLSIIALWG
jgi:predicted nucleic acid-binding protein